MRLFGLIGYPLEHAFSGEYFRKKFKNEGITDCRYQLFPLPTIEGFPNLLVKNAELEGLNVTIPYKEAVQTYLDKLDGEAFEIGAVNTIKIYQQGKAHFLKGFNTDAYGFKVSLNPHLKPQHNKALILGTGGASLAIKYVLDQLRIPYWIVSREPGPEKITYEKLTKEMVEDTKIIINTTPLGMYPKVDQCPPIPYEAIGSSHLLYDLVYNPEITQFLEKGRQQGSTIKNGLEMLEQQAEKSWEIWSNP